MEGTEVALAAIGIVATAVAALVWIVKFLMTEMRRSIDKNTKSHEKLSKTTQKNTEVSNETLKFMKRLNGKLEKATIQTVKEQKVEHQHIHSKDEV